LTISAKEKEAVEVNPKGNWLELVVICALFVLLSIWGIIWDITSGLLTGGIDGIMLLAVCLLMAAIFAMMLVLQLQKAGILPSFARKAKAAAAPSAAPKEPAAAAPAKPSQSAPQPTAQAK
jgi:bacteriorhodopsin